MQDKKSQDASLPKGRKQTDRSLSAERGKTDKAVAHESKRIEHMADVSVSSNRLEADEIRSQTRQDADELSKSQGSVVSKMLREERQKSDDALDDARRQIDLVIERERLQKSAADNKLFRDERTKTDKDLSDERVLTDTVSQQQLAAHAATQVALTSRNEFLAIVSHDLKNPLGSILMAAELLMKSDGYATSDAQTHKYIEMMERNAREGLRLISDLLDMERIAEGKLGLQIYDHRLDDIVRHAVGTFERLAESKGLTLTVAPGAEDLIVTCDRDRISQVLSNLIGNAIKFTPRGGTITLSAAPQAKGVRISVADTGQGISPGMQTAIFQRFWQIGKADRHGLGLGLYISKMIVEAHGGRISVDSAPARGSAFHFTLPKAV